MKMAVISIAAGLFALSAVPVSANDAVQNRATQQRPLAQAEDRSNRGDNRGDEGATGQYGRWQTSWGARPGAPPRSFARPADWYRHVRACQARYRSYDARTDRYVPARGRTSVCRL